MAEKDRGRIHLRMPKPLLEEIEKYQEENDLATRTHAIIELCKLGLEYSKKKETHE